MRVNVVAANLFFFPFCLPSFLPLPLARRGVLLLGFRQRPHAALMAVSMATLVLTLSSAGRCSSTVSTVGENINIAWSPNGRYIAVGNKEDVISVVDTRTFRVVQKTNFKIEVNEISWNVSGDYFFLTCGASGEGIVEVMRFGEDASLKPLRSVSAAFWRGLLYLLRFLLPSSSMLTINCRLLCPIILLSDKCAYCQLLLHRL